jgi:hypothetical protein
MTIKVMRYDVSKAQRFRRKIWCLSKNELKSIRLYIESQ